LSGINYLLNRLHSFPKREKTKDIEEKTTLKTYYRTMDMVRA
jgi:hypothetical protein